MPLPSTPSLGVTPLASPPNGRVDLRDVDELSTPSLTEGAETETEPEASDDDEHHAQLKRGQTTRSNSIGSSLEFERQQEKVTTRHDLDNRYFSQDLLIFKNFDLFRCVPRPPSSPHLILTRSTYSHGDFSFALVAFYGVMVFALPAPGASSSTQIVLTFINALFWRVFHTVGLGLALKAQSEKKWIVRHFLKHYHYEKEGGAVDDAFANWKKTYNLSLFMSYGTLRLGSLGRTPTHTVLFSVVLRPRVQVLQYPGRLDCR
mgnify:FL=1